MLYLDLSALASLGKNLWDTRVLKNKKLKKDLHLFKFLSNCSCLTFKCITFRP